MTNDLSAQLEEAIRRIAGCGTVAVVLPDELTPETAAAATALERGLKRLDKAVSVFAPPAPPDKTLLSWGLTGVHDQALREFVISFDLNRSPIKELKYERDQNRLNIILSPTSSRIRREDVEFRWGALRYDLIITLGVPTPGAAHGSIAAIPELLLEKPIINIDSDPANSGYGEINIIPSRKEADETPTMAELVYDILSGLKAPPDDPETATALLTSLIASGELHQVKSRALRLAAELIDRGADIKAAGRFLARARAPNRGQLAGRAMARSRPEKTASALWSTLTSDDFAKTKTGREALGEIMERLAEFMPHYERYVLLWQNPENGMVGVLIRCLRREEHSRLEESGEFIAEGKMLAAKRSFSSFQDAEEDIGRLLKPDDVVE